MSTRRQPQPPAAAAAAAAIRRRTLARRALDAVASPAIFDFWAGRVSRTWAWERTLARVVDVRLAAADAVTLVLRPNRHWAGCTAGEHVNVTVEVDGRRLTRSYSPSHADDGLLELTVKTIEGGRVSGHLCRDVRVGDVLELGTPFGAMRLPPPGDAPLLFLAAGSGITPLVAMLRAFVAQGRSEPLTLLYWVRRREQVCFAETLRAIARQHPNIDVRFLLTADAAIEADEAHGRLDATHLAAFIDTTHVFACGPDAFVEHARALVAARAASFVAEAFTLPATPLADAETGHVTVTLARSGRSLQLPRGDSLLTALEANGVKPPSGCRMGICNTCACGKSAGTTRHLRTGERDGEPATALRLCVHAASTDLVLDL